MFDMANPLFDKYRNTLRYPLLKSRPAILDKKAGDLTAEDIAQIPALRAQHALEIEAFEKAKEDFEKENQRLRDKFKEDLEKENGTTGRPKADLLFAKACANYPPVELLAIARYYHEFADLIKE